MYDIKALYEAENVQDAIRLLTEHPQAQIIAGGSDVLVQIREGKRAGVELVSIYGLDELRGVSLEEDETLRIGSLTSFSHITKNELQRLRKARMIRQEWSEVGLSVRQQKICQTRSQWSAWWKM